MTRRPPRILFACIGNSARSQMAEGFARALAGDRIEVRSGGSRPLGYVLPEAIQVMREKGIDVSGHPSRGFDEEWVRGCDLVVTMGCGDDARRGSRWRFSARCGTRSRGASRPCLPTWRPTGAAAIPWMHQNRLDGWPHEGCPWHPNRRK
jgi:hypothetical protein